MKLTGGEIVVRALEDEGVRFAFGIPGTHNIELYDALATSTKVRTVLITDEQSAGFMADAVWRASGELACVNIVPGAGLTHALSGIAEAYMDGIPLLVLGCGIRQDSGRAYQLHDIDQLAIAAPVTKKTYRVTAGGELYATLREAALLARSGTPGPVMVEVPVNLYLFRHEVNTSEWGAPTTLVPPRPDPVLVRRAAARLRAPDARPLLYGGLGAQGADLIRLAERLGAPVATTIQGKGVFPESHPLFVWNGFGDAAPPFARDVADRCNVTLALGLRFSEVGTGSYSCVPRGDLIHVDINADVLNRNYPAAIPIVADAGEFVRALLTELGPGAGPVRPEIAEGRAEVRRSQRAHPSADRVSPAALIDQLQRRLGPETIYTTDSGNGTFLAMEHLVLEGPGRFLAPIDYSCMGYSVPAAIGAKLAKPDAPVVALVGDGAFLMTGLELLTAASQHLPIAFFILRDRELAQIAQFQATALNRKTASILPDYDVGSLAEAVGIEWLRLDRDSELDPVLGELTAILGAGRPVVIDTAIDYSEKTFFTRGVIKTNLARLPWTERIRMVARAVARRL